MKKSIYLGLSFDAIEALYKKRIDRLNRVRWAVMLLLWLAGLVTAIFCILTNNQIQ